MTTPKKNDAENSDNSTEMVNTATGEVIEAQLTNRELMEISADEQSLRELIESWGLAPSDLIIGDAYPLAEKDDLIGVPLALVQWKFGTSRNFGSEYVQIKAVRMDTQSKVGIFDSGLGIYGALNELTDARIAAGKPAYNGAIVQKGLTKSEYPPKFDENGVMVRPAGVTYYFA